MRAQVEPGPARVIVHRLKRRLRDALLLEMLVRRCERCAEALASQLP
jgi:hypothetical protein